MEKYKTCGNYCMTIGMFCMNAYEEVSNTCVHEKQHSCDENVPTGDLICECSADNNNGKEI